MPWFQTQIKQRDALLSPLFSVSLSSSASPPPLPSTFPKQQSTPSSSSSSSSKISPAVLFIIIILALVFFIAGLLHLLVRFLLKKRSSSSPSQSNRYPEMATPDAYDRQLQQLFHLHDSGLDQAFVDALPVFLYKDIVGLKEPFDCAVCLCEFSPNDKLRLLPLCSHAFHIDCIDTWLLSNSTCPLCRGTLFTPGFSIENPVFDFDDRIEEDGFLAHGLRGENDIEKRVFSVRLGKFRTLNGDNGGERKEGETSRSNLDARRCFSMGSCQYVVANSDLQVALCPNRENGRGGILKGRGGHNVNSGILGDNEGKRINIGSKNESFSVSKIWLWSRKDKHPNSSDNHLSNSSVNVSLPRRTEKALAR